MGLLHEIQASLVDGKTALAPILMKLRLLASRLGNNQLEDWVKFETEGYPEDRVVPEYRKVQVSFRGTFFGPYNSAITNAQIPPAVIAKFVSESWLKHTISQSMAAIDELLESSANGNDLTIDASDLILILQGKVYEGYACNAVVGTISRTSIVDIQSDQE